MNTKAPHTKLQEDFRLNIYLIDHLALLSDRTTPKVQMTYSYYSITAFYTTIDDLADLENEENFINNGRKVIPNISLWFLAFESLINCLCKITCLTLGSDPEPLLKKEVTGRFSDLLSLMNYDTDAIKRTGIYNRINDFRKFRNEIFHDRGTGNTITFSKTNFSPIPSLSNQVDIFQSILIFLEVATLLRYSIPALDLMPNISMGNSTVLHFDKLDTLYKSFLVPNFKACLEKHNLSTELNFEDFNFTSLEPSSIFQYGEIVPLFRHDQEEKFKNQNNTTTTTIGRDLYNSVLKAYSLPENHTGSPNYVIDWGKMYEENRPFLIRR